MNKKVYVYNVISLGNDSTLVEKARPSTIDFYIHKRLIQKGYTECVWVDEQEYVFANIPEGIEEYTVDYYTLETYLDSLGYNIEYLSTTSSILV